MEVFLLKKAQLVHKAQKNVQKTAFNCLIICATKEIYFPLHPHIENEIVQFINQKLKVMSEIASRVNAIIVDKLGVEESEVKNEASFTNDLGADSLDTVELIMEFEKEFGISIPDDQAETIKTVGDAVSYIEANSK